MPSVTKRAKGDRAARREEMTRRLLEVTEDLLDEGQTFTEISVEQLIQGAGMSRSTFYFYFEDKGDLLRALASDLLAEFGDATREWWASDEVGSREELHASLTRVVDIYRPHARIMAAVVETSGHDAGVREEYSRMITGYTAQTTTHIKRGQKAGRIRSDLPAAETAGLISWMLERGCNELVRFTDDAGARRVVDALTAVIWNTLYAE